MAIKPNEVIPQFMLADDQIEDVIQFLHDMPIPDADKETAFRWWASQVGHAVTDEDMRRVKS